MNVVIYEFGAAPFEIAGFGVERDNSALITAGCAVKDAVFDEWGFSVAPVLLFAAEVAEVFFPDHFAIQVGGEKGAFAADGVNVAINDGGRSARAVTPRTVFEHGGHFSGPEFLAVFFIEGDEEFFLVARAHDVDATIGNGWCGVSGAEVFDKPDAFGAGFRPFLEEAFFRGFVVAGGSAPLRPIFCLNG